jgi:hypothetical protein
MAKRPGAVGCLLIVVTVFLICFSVRCVQSSSVATGGSIEFLRDEPALVARIGCEVCDSGMTVYDDGVTIDCLAHFAGVGDDAWLGASICPGGDYDLDGEADLS